MLTKYFNHDAFKTRLWDTIAQIEQRSLVEVVVIIKPRSEVYTDINLWCGTLTSFIVYTFFMFSPWFFGDYLIYTGTIAAFTIGSLFSMFIPALHRACLPRKRMRRSVEIMARALFQKAGIYNTHNRTGTFIYLSLFERMVHILPDNAAYTAIPFDEWEKFNTQLETIFTAPNPADALLQVLEAHQALFSQYLPPIENDINELPDDLEVNI
ncbi:TPM domain-containing protein [Beggiatoa leptomitoformis]|uniref:TPM domain-containing protein n=1 Tax=Beggiatoa leptomitoformis TaxID=288004 RepID=A0A2N9YCF4_9GAMM|nr:hypothetical protein [Beggiatoa leptomitoformis]ALG66553.1 hypothetical protein AL038_00870 [Beggiatoa leptomitoformis]AUI68148.1 hypothetical protein BLE401_05175 [Beggiatoa leptomitoformis]